jgi:small subunit ribosomal protein S10e
VYYFLIEGTLVAKKDFNADKHSDALPIPNLEVLLLLRSFKSKGFVKETFNWQYYYYYLTNEGIEYLRQYLALPAEIVPATLKKAATAEPTRPDGFKGKSTGPGGDFNPEFQRDRGNRDGYRR